MSIEAETQEIESLSPAFKNNNIVIGMSSSNEYMPYLSVCLKSIVDNASDEYNYDIVVFERAITERNKEILKTFIQRKNISLRFINPMPLLTKYSLSFPEHYALECFFRLTSPLIFREYEKIIFTDIDLVFQHDIKDLYEINMEGKPLAACVDLKMTALLNSYSEDWNEYCKKTLKLKDPYKYVNTGVIILDVQQFNNNNYTQKLLEIASGSSFRVLEQDIFNLFFKDNITYIEEEWNFPVANKIHKPLFALMSDKFKQKYDEYAKNPKIIHWTGVVKSWHSPEEDYAEIWWNYARQVPFYEIILKRMIEFSISPSLIKDVYNYKKNIYKYLYYKLLSNFAIGETKSKYKKNLYP